MDQVSGFEIEIQSNIEEFLNIPTQGINKLIKVCPTRLNLARFTRQPQHGSFSQEKLIAQLILCERNIHRLNIRIDRVKGSIAAPCRSERMPYRSATGPANVDGPMMHDEAIHLSQQPGQVIRQVRNQFRIVNLSALPRDTRY